MPRRVSSSPTALTRRQVLAAGLAAPLLPTMAAARGRPRYRKRRRAARRTPEQIFFAGGGPADLATLQRRADALWQGLQPPLARAALGRASPPWRALDLLAGLALRYGRPELLAALLAAAATLPGAAPRLAKWARAEGPWQRRWTKAANVTWAWHDGGHLTRAALPLTLPA